MQLKIDTHGRKDRSSLRLNLVVPPHSFCFSRLCQMSHSNLWPDNEYYYYQHLPTPQPLNIRCNSNQSFSKTGRNPFKESTRKPCGYPRRACPRSRFHNWNALVTTSSMSDIALTRWLRPSWLTSLMLPNNGVLPPCNTAPPLLCFKPPF